LNFISVSKTFGVALREQSECVKKSAEGQKHVTQRRKDVEGAKKTSQLFFVRLCVLVRRLTDELFDFLTRSL
jgi:hypothetical protein